MDESGTVIIDRHLYLTEDRTRVVEEGDPASRWLWASPGTQVSRAEAVRLGAISGEAEQAPTPERTEAPKQRSPRSNKSRGATEDKSSGSQPSAGQ
ncbi:hypothetical protein [Streptomyces sp. NPDC012888]|uniref:hypothetical protein n=1 Tax=Streptomyces sp. NPDC012888 TaxID=3364855 RepID=UPI0036B869CD